MVISLAGIGGTVVSGLLAARSAQRMQGVEIDSRERLRTVELAEERGREQTAQKRDCYVELNQALRNFQALLDRHVRFLADAAVPPAPPAEESAAVEAVRSAYARAQMIASDAVVLAAGAFTESLYFLHACVQRHDPAAGVDLMTAMEERVWLAKEQSYAVRQEMRRDLGITDLPVTRPPLTPRPFSSTPGAGASGTGGSST